MGRYVFYWEGGGGGPGLCRAGSLVNFLQIGAGVKSVLFSIGGESQFFWQGKNLLDVASILSKLFTGVEKFIYQKTIFSQLT